MRRQPLRRVVIVGGGASGTLVAVALLRRASAARPVAISIIEKRGYIGPGLAYSTTDPQHLLNSTVGQMSALEDEPEHLLRWLLGRGIAATSNTYLPRSTFGEYLVWLLETTRVPAGSRLDRVYGEAVDVVEEFDSVAVTLDDGRILSAESVVLALGNPPGRRTSLGSSRAEMVDDPWAAGALDAITSDDRVLLVGTGLTTVDVALTLARSRPSIELTAVSRHGLLPRRHTSVPVNPKPHAVPENCTLRELVRLMRGHLSAAEQSGEGWRTVIDGMRPSLSEIWQRLSRADRESFVRHLARRWEIHRHRMAPQVAEKVRQLIEAGQLRILTTAELDSADHFTHVINCTGPQPVASPGWSLLVDRLLDRGTARPNELGLGMDTDHHAALIGETGGIQQRTYAIGFARRGTAWECTAVPEIRAPAGRATRGRRPVRRRLTTRPVRPRKRRQSRRASPRLRCRGPSPRTASQTASPRAPW